MFQLEEEFDAAIEKYISWASEWEGDLPADLSAEAQAGVFFGVWADFQRQERHVEDQATDRVHRIGQERTVYVYRILTESTLEERIDRLLEEKRGMADRIIGAATGGSAGWSRDELLELLQPLN